MKTRAAETAYTRKRLGAGISATDRSTLAQWDDYALHVDAMGRTLIDNFSDQTPPQSRDRVWARHAETETLTHAGEACTG